MQDGNRKEFLIIVKTKKFINYLDKILVNISKKDYRYKDNLINISLELLSLYYQVNSEINNDIVKKDLIIIKNKLSMIDFYIELFFEKGYFEKSNVSNLCKKTLEIAKMTSGWEKYKFGNKDAEKIVTVKNLLNIYETEISKGVKNKKKLINFEKGKMCYINDMVTNILNETYKPNKYNIFLIYEPTLRLVMSSSIYDKVINHFVTRHILEPKLSKYLNNRNCATRKNMGTSYALKLFLSDIEKNKKYDKCYFLKLDIKKYFYNIDHNVLKSMIKNDLDEDEFNLVCKLIDCTNEEYINEIINKYRKQGYEIPIYKYDKGLSIGARTNQFFAILYLSKLQHYIIHNLHLKYIINYMDDYIIIHHNKEYLNNCLKEIENKLNNEYKLVLNKNKTYIKSFKEGVVFLGYNIKVINKKTIIKLSRNTKNNIKNKTKKLKYLYNNEQINFQSLFSSLSTYKNSYIFVNKYITRNIVNKYF